MFVNVQKGLDWEIRSMLTIQLTAVHCPDCPPSITAAFGAIRGYIPTYCSQRLISMIHLNRSDVQELVLSAFLSAWLI